MIKLTLAQCIKATNQGVFVAKNLNLTQPLSLEDMVLLSEYLRITPLHSLDLSLVITQENSYGLKGLSQVIAENTQLTQLRFVVEQVHFTEQYKNNSGLAFIDDYKLKQIDKRVLNAMIDMVGNKPNLQELTVNLEKLGTAATKRQARHLSRAISETPLKSLELSIAVVEEAKLPVIQSQQNNVTLSDFKLFHCSYGSDVLNHLKNTSGLRTLILDDMWLSPVTLTALESVLKSNPYLNRLIINKTNMGDLDSNDVIDALKLSTNLHMLQCSDNCFSPSNVSALCNYLSRAECTLTELNITRIAYNGGDMGQITAALTHNTKLKKLVLDGNMIEDKGLQAVIELLKTNHHITSISMSLNCRHHPSDETINKLCALLRDPNCPLQELNFDQTTSFEQLKMLTEALLANTSLTQVKLNYKYHGVLGMAYKFKIEHHISGSKPIGIDSSLTTSVFDNHSMRDSQSSEPNSPCSFFPHFVTFKKCVQAPADHFNEEQKSIAMTQLG